ncbi:MAG: endonuclease [Paludibacteraceae bacterium]|nr:endonuclease [Paludibacteraceae bacterium]
MKKHFFLIALCISAWAFADTPDNYYVSVDGKTGDAILDALYSKVSSHDNVGYDGLYDLYKYTDADANGNLFDIYSSCNFTVKTDECSSGYKNVCDCYNREHTVPQSWFGSGLPKSDVFNVYPTDGKVNNQRGNYPYGECANGVKCDNSSNAKGRLGTSTFSGYSGKVFEPDDEFKGDLARSYFYMCAAYRTTTFLKSSEGEVVFTYNDKKTNLTQYAINLFMKWHREDPVSEKS